MLTADMLNQPGGKVAVQTTNLLRLLCGPEEICKHNPPGGPTVFDRLCLMIRTFTADVMVVSNGCRILLQAILATLATTPAITQEVAQSIGFGIEAFMAPTGVVFSLLAVLADESRRFNEFVYHYALAAFATIFHMLTPEWVAALVERGLVKMVVDQLLHATNTRFATAQVVREVNIRKCTDALKVLLDVIAVNKDWLGDVPQLLSAVVACANVTSNGVNCGELDLRLAAKSVLDVLKK